MKKRNLLHEKELLFSIYFVTRKFAEDDTWAVPEAVFLSGVRGSHDAGQKALKSLWTKQWMNEWMNERMNEWIKMNAYYHVINIFNVYTWFLVM